MKALLSLIALSTTLATANLSAQTTSWTGAVDGQWGLASNWSPSGIPSDLALTFNDVANQAINLGGVERLVQGLTFNSTTPYTFTNGTLRFNATSTILQNGSGGISFSAPVDIRHTRLSVGGSGSGGVVFDGLRLNRGSGTTTTLTAQRKGIVIGGVITSDMDGSNTFGVTSNVGSEIRITGSIQDNGPTKRVTLGINGTGSASGVVYLEGANSYTGNTSINNAGTLIVTGTNSGGARVNINKGLLGGTGRIGIATTSHVDFGLDSGDVATLSPGDPRANGGIGTLVFDGGGTNAIVALRIGGRARFEFDLGAVNASDKIVFENFAVGGGGASTTAEAGGITFLFREADGFQAGGVYNLIEFAAASSIALDRFAVSMDSEVFGTFGYSDNTLTFTAVPEPSVLSGVGLLSMGAFLFQRRKIRSAK